MQPGLARAFDRLILGSTSANQTRKILLGLEVRLTSSDWTAIYSSTRLKFIRIIYPLARLLPRRAASKLSNYFRKKPMPSFQTALVLRKNLVNVKSEQRRYLSTINLKSHTLLRCNSSPTDELLVIWTSSRGRPQMPLATFLQTISHRPCDVLVFRPNNESYREGIHGWGDNVREVYDSLNAFVKLEGYRRTYIIGTSLGTAPALLGCQSPSVTQILLVGPIDPRREYNSDFEDIVNSNHKHGSIENVTSITGSLSDADNFVASFLEKTLGISRIVIEGAGHNPLWPLVVRNKISAWFDTNLFDKTT
jgi:hypothetical protein